MVTRLKSKNLQSKNQKKPDANHEKLDEIQKKPVRLTKGLLYIVNKKLQEMDSSARLQKIDEYFNNSTQRYVKFDEINYRQNPKQNHTEESLAVMHKAYFDLSSIAKPVHDTIGVFEGNLMLYSLDWNFAPSVSEFMRLHNGGVEAEISRPDLFRFIKLPDDYNRPNLGVDFFEELSWNEEGSILVEASQLSKFFLIFDISKWLFGPADYRLVCSGDRTAFCECRDIYTILWSSTIFRRIFQEEGIEGPLKIGSANELASSGNMTAVHQLIENMFAVYLALLGFEEKLRRAEIKLYDSNELNRFAAFQIKVLAEKLEAAKECQTHYVDYLSDEWGY